MASVTGERRPSILLTLLGMFVLVVVAIVALNWVLNVVSAIIQLVLVLIALYLLARIGMFLLRKGR